MIKAGKRFTATTADVFPEGCVLVPGSITEAMEYDEHGKSGQARDKVTGQLVWQCRVMDNDSTLGARSRETVVKILSDRMPVSPVGDRYDAVEFDGLTITPYVDSGRCRGTGKCTARMAFSLRTTGLKAVRNPAAKDAA
jgi:hypothetical protein